MVDEVGEDSGEDVDIGLLVLDNQSDVVTHDGGDEVLPQPVSHPVIDSHFHLDLTSKKIWGISGGDTVEELLSYSDSDDASRRPGLPVDVVGGVIVCSEPKTYPAADFHISGPWKVDVGVHQKHYDTLTIEWNMHLNRLLENPFVVALGECGLDRVWIAPCL